MGCAKGVPINAGLVRVHDGADRVEVRRRAERVVDLLVLDPTRFHQLLQRLPMLGNGLLVLRLLLAQLKRPQPVRAHRSANHARLCRRSRPHRLYPQYAGRREQCRLSTAGCCFR